MTSIVAFLSAWYVLPFVFALTLATMLFVVEIIFGGLSDFGLDFDADGDLDFDLDFDSDFELDMPHLLSWLGLGKVPVSILLELTLFFFGAMGLFIMSIVPNPLGLVIALPVSLIFTVQATHFLAIKISNIMPQHSTTSKHPSQLIGEVGSSLSTVEDSFGQVSVNGAVVNARTTGSTISRGTEVVLVSYDDERRHYIVEPMS